MKLPFLNHRAVVFALLLAIFLLWLGASPRAGAQSQRLPKPSGHVNDFGEVLDAPTRDRLETVLENLKQKTELDFVVVIVKSAGAEDLYSYSLNVANDWNVGAPASLGKSLLLVITADNGKFFTQITRG